jgi:prepilin peptidase CpaA
VTCVVTALLLGAGAVVDIRTRRIPNVVTLATALVGLGLAAAGVTQVTIAQSVAGGILGALLMMPGYLLGATGAGDVKALGAAGALLGVRRVPAAFLYTAIAGGVVAVAVLLARRRTATPDRFFPYGPAIAVGCLLAALGL